MRPDHMPRPYAPPHSPVDERTALVAEFESFARRLRAIADREASLAALRAAEHVVAAARELELDVAP